MSNLDRIAKISIELQSVVSSGASFDHILIVGPAPKTPLESVTIPDVGVYTSLPAVNEMGWVSEGDSADPVGIAARIAFSQNPKPTQIYIAVQKTESAGSTLEAATATLSRAEAAETGWYCALAAGIEEEDFEDMAEWTEAREKIFGYSYKDEQQPRNQNLLPHLRHLLRRRYRLRRSLQARRYGGALPVL